MSTEESLDPQLIEQTKQQIRSLVNEIAQLTKEDRAPDEFYGEFLPRVVSALAAIGGAVWTTNEDGRLALQYQVNLQQTNLRDNEEGLAQHSRLLYKCLAEGEGMLVAPHSGAGEMGDAPAGNPTDYLLVLGPLKTDLESVGVLEIFQRSEAGPNTQKGYLRFLLQMCELATDFLKSHQLKHFADRQVLWSRLEDFTHNVHTALEPRETAYTIANEGRRLIECDRVSVAIRRGNRCKIEAVSGQDLFDKRSNVVRLLGKLATAVVKTGEPVWYTGDTSDMAPQVEDAVQEYIDESHSKNVAVLPLKRPELEEEDDPQKRSDSEPPIGALIVEQIEDSRVPQSMIQRVEVVCRHSSTALANALEHNDLFLMPLWRLLGKTKWILKARTLPKTMAITSIILVLLLGLFLWPADFELHAKGSLEPIERSDVFAKIDGVVEQIHVEHGDLVYTEQIRTNALAAAGGLFATERRTIDEAFLDQLSETLLSAEIYQGTIDEIVGEICRTYVPDPDDPAANPGNASRDEILEIVGRHIETLLVTLRSDQLEIARNEVLGKKNATWSRIQAIDRARNDPRLTQVESDRLSGERQVLLAQMASLNAQLKLYDEELKEEEVRSPRRGMVITWEVKERLNRRPVQKGQVLMQIADPEGPWQLELDMPEHRMGHIARAQNAVYADLRTRLREVLREKNADMTDEDLDAALKVVPNRELSSRLRELLSEELGQAWRERIDELLAEWPETDEEGAEKEEAVELRARLEEVRNEPSYAKSHAMLGELLPEIPLGPLRDALKELLDDGLDDRLPVTYIMATDPNVEFVGRVAEIHGRAEAHSEEGNTVLIKLAIDDAELPHPLRPGATATAKVYCGRRAIGYCWFHDLIAFVQSRILFRFF